MIPAVGKSCLKFCQKLLPKESNFICWSNFWWDNKKKKILF